MKKKKTYALISAIKYVIPFIFSHRFQIGKYNVEDEKFLCIFVRFFYGK